MDFITALTQGPKGNIAVWVIVDRLTKSSHFIPFRLGQSMELLAEKYLQEVVRLHGIPISIVSDRDTIFLYHFLEKSSREPGGTTEI